eukprot:COSAG02_NODE_48927_length_330_cov_0.948052_1_plen_62_part_10
MARNRCPASRAPKDHHFAWVATECFRVLLDPLQLRSYHESVQLAGISSYTCYTCRSSQNSVS